MIRRIYITFDNHEYEVYQVIHNECVIFGLPEWFIATQYVHFHLNINMDGVEHCYHMDGKVLLVKDTKFYIRFMNPCWVKYFVSNRVDFDKFNKNKH